MGQVSIDRFVKRLEVIGGIAPESSVDRGAMAALRRCMMTWPSSPPEAVRVIAPFLREQDGGWSESVYYVIGALFASHPKPLAENESAGSLATSLRKAADEEKAGGRSGEGVERRLLGLLGCKSEDLPNHLRHAISFLKSKGVPVDYRRLMRDLSFWDREGGRVQRAWGRDFWGGIEQETEGKV